LQVSTLSAPTVPVLKFLTHPAGQGVVYNVIVHDPDNQMEAAYSPVATYGCRDCKEKRKLQIKKPITLHCFLFIGRSLLMSLFTS